MPLPAAVDAVTGARELFDWFGYWPDFHDAEIIQFRLEAGAPTSLVIHTWGMTDEVDAKGFYELRKHVVVEFVIEAISTINLSGSLGSQHPLRTKYRQKRQWLPPQLLLFVRPLRNY
jgi:hypothetical protein